MIELISIEKSYCFAGKALPVLRNVSLNVCRGEFVAIMGASGSGKTTLLNILGCLDTPDRGEYVLDNNSVHCASERTLAALRSKYIGFVFQSFNLIPRISAARNVELPLIYAGVDAEDRRVRVHNALHSVGMTDRYDHSPAQLSGGQQQRIAIARALINSPELLVADEPTGALDSANAAEIMNIFARVNNQGTTIIMVTHERDIAQKAKRIVYLRNGAVQDDRPVGRRR